MLQRIFYLALFILLLLLMPASGFPYDLECWNAWAIHIYKYGLQNAYKSGTDYLPLFQYELFIFGKLANSTEVIHDKIWLLKSITLAFDFLGGFFILKLVKTNFSDKKILFYYSLLYFLNPAIYYNSLLWFQFDGILASLLFISIYYAIQEKVLLSLIFMLLAINFKLQAIVLLPVMAIILLPSMISQFNLKKVTAWILLPCVLQFLIVLPFYLAGELHRIIEVVIHSFGKFPFVSMNAGNIWQLIFSGPLYKMSDQGAFLNITYKSWGLLLFCITSFFALLPLLKNLLLLFQKKPANSISKEIYMLISALIILLFFYFNTQMHERYSHPALLFVIAYSMLSKNIFPSLLFTLIYVLNLDSVYRILHYPNYSVFIYTKIFMGISYGVLILYLFIQLYRLKKNEQDCLSLHYH